MGIWIKGGELIDPVQGSQNNQDLIIEGERIVDILPQGEFKDHGPQLKVIDASGKIVVPGLIDMHVHLREPGHEHKETVASGSRAGVAGGFTGLACMPNTDPVNDSVDVTRFVLEKAQEADFLRVYPIAAITRGQEGDTLTSFKELKEAGAVGVSDDGRPVTKRDVMKRALEEGRDQGLTVISHCEDTSLSVGGVMHEGIVSRQLGFRGIPALSEGNMVQREVELAGVTNCPVHIAHVSTAQSVEIIRKAKEDGIRVTAETAPHYFDLDHGAVIEKGANAKMNPPLRTHEDVEAVKRGLAGDTISVIATDHAPHSPQEKEMGFEEAPFGVLGLETAVPLTIALVKQGVLSLPAAIRKLSYTPATILGIEGGILQVGAVADVAIIDPEIKYVFTAEDLHSKSMNSPFLGRTLTGRNEITIVGGKIVFQRQT